MKHYNVTREKLDKLLHDQKGKFFSVTFQKVDGTMRKINGRLGVVKYLKGGKNLVVKYDNPYQTVFDVKCMGYRTTNLHTITKVYASNVVYSVIEE